MVDAITIHVILNYNHLTKGVEKMDTINTKKILDFDPSVINPSLLKIISFTLSNEGSCIDRIFPISAVVLISHLCPLMSCNFSLRNHVSSQLPLKAL